MRSNRQQSLIHSSGHVEAENQQHPSLSATSITNQETKPLENCSLIFLVLYPTLEFLSQPIHLPNRGSFFSLGLTQEDQIIHTAGYGDIVDNDKVDDQDTFDDSPLSRKSKKLWTIPPGLVNNYQCRTATLNRAWK